MVMYNQNSGLDKYFIFNPTHGYYELPNSPSCSSCLMYISEDGETVIQEFFSTLRKVKIFTLNSQGSFQ